MCVGSYQHQVAPLQRYQPRRIAFLLVLLAATADLCQSRRPPEGRLAPAAESVAPEVDDELPPLLDYSADTGYGEQTALWRGSGQVGLRQLYRAIIREYAIRRTGTGHYLTGKGRKKRPTNGLLGIDNLDFTASTLDRARARSRKPQDSDWQIAKQMSKHISTQTAPGQPRQLSMSVSLTDLRRMLDMIKAGR